MHRVRGGCHIRAGGVVFRGDDELPPTGGPAMAAEAAPTSFLSTRRGKLTLSLLCAVAFLDFVDGPIVNISRPSIRNAQHFSVGDLQWLTSGYLLTNGVFMLLGGRPAELFG